MTYLIKFNSYTDTLKYLKWLQKITPVLSKKVTYSQQFCNNNDSRPWPDYDFGLTIVYFGFGNNCSHLTDIIFYHGHW